MSGWAYMLRCSDDSFYVGSTSYADVDMRVAEHNDAKYIGYTAARRPVALVWSMRFDDLRDAHETERRIKGWSRSKKAALIIGDDMQLRALSARRVRKPVAEAPHRSRRELSYEMHATGAKFVAPAVSTPSRQIARTKRTAAEAQAAKQPRLLAQTRARHPEVRAKRAPKDG
jgi:putative endonuclease